MSLRRSVLSVCCLMAAWVAFMAPGISLAGEPIRFSKPAVPLAMPGRELPRLPEGADKKFELNEPEPPSTMELMLRQQSQRIPIPTRQKELEDDTSPLAMRDPHRKLEQAMQAQDRLNPPLPKREFGREKSIEPSSKDPWNPMRKDEFKSLSPITDFGWQPNDRLGRNAESGRDGRGSRSRPDRDKQAESSPFATVNDFDFDPTRPATLSDLFATKSKDKLTAQQLERRAAFEKLLNPGAPAPAKGPGSLEPVGAGDARSVAGLNTPALGGTLSRLPEDPTTAFNRQQERLRGPAMEDSYNKYSAPARPEPARPTSPFQTPLNQEPIRREFPVRRL